MKGNNVLMLFFGKFLHNFDFIEEGFIALGVFYKVCLRKGFGRESALIFSPLNFKNSCRASGAQFFDWFEVFMKTELYNFFLKKIVPLMERYTEWGL